MKKIYIAPEMAIVNIELQEMIANSGIETKGFGYDEPSETNETSGNLSRGGSLWDDED